MNLQQLRYFTTVAKLQNISKAAGLLHVSQSTLSKQISHLEEEFGTSFFDRNGRKITINRAGQRFVECSNRVLREVETAKEDISILSKGNDRRIRVGMAGAHGAFLSAMASFSLIHPDTEFECCQGLAFEENADINDYDVMIYPDEMKFEKLKGYPLYEEHYVLALPAKERSEEKAQDRAKGRAKERPGEKSARQQTFSLSLLEQERMVFLRGKKGTYEYPYHVMHALAVPVTGVSFADTREMHLRMIASGMGIGFVPKEEAQLYQRDRNIRLLPVLDRRFSRAMQICFRREKHLTGLAREFCDYLTETLSLKTAQGEPGPGSNENRRT